MLGAKVITPSLGSRAVEALRGESERCGEALRDFWLMDL
jgi:hypothetical protein